MLTQWFDNGDGILVCSANGERLDHPEAHLVVLRLLLTESGQYILPVNNKQKDVELNNAEKSRIKSMLQGLQPCQSTTLEQSGNSHRDQSDHSDNDAQHDIKHYDKTNLRSSDAQHDTSHDDQPQSGNYANKGKLQFTAERNLANGLCTGASPGLMTGTSDGLCDGQKQVADDEPPIQVLLGNDYNLEYDEMEHTYEGDVFPGHLPEGMLKYLQKMYKAVPEEFYSKSNKAPVTPRNARPSVMDEEATWLDLSLRSGNGAVAQEDCP